jgi:hypothetical protein
VNPIQYFFVRELPRMRREKAQRRRERNEAVGELVSDLWRLPKQLKAARENAEQELAYLTGRKEVLAQVERGEEIDQEILDRYNVRYTDVTQSQYIYRERMRREAEDEANRLLSDGVSVEQVTERIGAKYPSYVKLKLDVVNISVVVDEATALIENGVSLDETVNYLAGKHDVPADELHGALREAMMETIIESAKDKKEKTQE